MLALIVISITDVTQTNQAIRRNYPVVGRFRYFFDHLGSPAEFFLDGLRGATVKSGAVLAEHAYIKIFEMKLSQEANPGKGGILFGGKVTPEISTICGIKVGEDSISPNRHPDTINPAIK